MVSYAIHICTEFETGELTEIDTEPAVGVAARFHNRVATQYELTLQLQLQQQTNASGVLQIMTDSIRQYHHYFILDAIATVFTMITAQTHQRPLEHGDERVDRCFQ